MDATWLPLYNILVSRVLTFPRPWHYISYIYWLIVLGPICIHRQFYLVVQVSTSIWLFSECVYMYIPSRFNIHIIEGIYAQKNESHNHTLSLSWILLIKSGGLHDSDQILDLNASLHAHHIINYLYKMMRLYIYLLKRRINDSEFWVLRVLSLDMWT